MLARRMESNPVDFLDREFNRMLGRFKSGGQCRDCHATCRAPLMP